MPEIGAECPHCSARLGQYGCHECGWHHTKSGEGLAMYRQVEDRPRLACSPDDICPECGKHVREHIQELKQLVQRIGRV